MKPTPQRKILPELVIIGAVLFGAWTLLLQPMRQNLAQARAAHANAIEHTRIAGDPALATPRLQMIMRSINGMIDDIQERSDIARDQTALQARLMSLGADSGVRIDRINPARSRAAGSANTDDRVSSFEIECSGPYKDVNAFLGELEANAGLTLIERLSIRPDSTGSGTAVRARIRTLHFAFDTSVPQPTAQEILASGGSAQ